MNSKQFLENVKWSGWRFHCCCSIESVLPDPIVRCGIFWVIVNGVENQCSTYNNLRHSCKQMLQKRLFIMENKSCIWIEEFISLWCRSKTEWTWSQHAAHNCTALNERELVFLPRYIIGKLYICFIPLLCITTFWEAVINFAGIALEGKIPWTKFWI